MAADRKIAVVGAGLMGHGIALTMARAGHSVKITDPDSQARETVLDRIAGSLGLLGPGDAAISDIQDRIEVCASTDETVSAASFVFEAAPESLELKRQVFAEIERHSSETCILASNTSVMPITQIMKNLRVQDLTPKASKNARRCSRLPTMTRHPSARMFSLPRLNWPDAI